MKKILLSFALGISLLTLSACGISNRENSQEDSAASISIPKDGSYNINPSASSLAWRAAKVTAAHTGRAAIKSGSVDVSQGKLAAGSITIDMTGISSDENLSGLIKHLSSPDFFDTALYPEAGFTIASIQPGERDNEYLISGDLTIKGVSAPISTVATAISIGEGLEIKTSFAIDRTKWGLNYGSGRFFEGLGDKMIDDEIMFDIILQAER